MTSALVEGGCSTPHSGSFTPGEWPSTHLTGSWVGPWGRLERWGKSGPPTPTEILSPKRPARSELPYLLSYPGLRCWISKWLYTAWIIRQKNMNGGSVATAKVFCEGGEETWHKSALRAFYDRNSKQFGLWYKTEKLLYVNFQSDVNYNVPHKLAVSSKLKLQILMQIASRCKLHLVFFFITDVFKK